MSHADGFAGRVARHIHLTDLNRTPTSLRDAQLLLRMFGMMIYKTEWQEYRVNYVGGAEATAYYTNDMQDAVGTARKMDEERRKRRAV